MPCWSHGECMCYHVHTCATGSWCAGICVCVFVCTCTQIPMCTSHGLQLHRAVAPDCRGCWQQCHQAGRGREASSAECPCGSACVGAVVWGWRAAAGIRTCAFLPLGGWEEAGRGSCPSPIPATSSLSSCPQTATLWPLHTLWPAGSGLATASPGTLDKHCLPDVVCHLHPSISDVGDHFPRMLSKEGPNPSGHFHLQRYCESHSTDGNIEANKGQVIHPGGVQQMSNRIIIRKQVTAQSPLSYTQDLCPFLVGGQEGGCHTDTAPSNLSSLLWCWRPGCKPLTQHYPPCHLHKRQSPL